MPTDRDKLPFDIAQMRTVFYDHQDLKSAADCRAQIAAQLHEALEKGAVDSPVAASVNLAHLQGGNPSEQVLAQLVSTVEGMAADTGRLERMTEALLERTSISARDRARDPHAVDAIISAVRRLEDMSERRADKELLSVCREILAPAHYLADSPRYGSKSRSARHEALRVRKLHAATASDDDSRDGTPSESAGSSDDAASRDAVPDSGLS